MADPENSEPSDPEVQAMTVPAYQTKQIRYSISLHQTTIPEVYHLIGIENYGSWAFRMKNVLLRDGLFDYCSVPPSQDMSEHERKGRQIALSAINSSVKGDVALKLLKRYFEPFECWYE